MKLVTDSKKTFMNLPYLPTIFERDKRYLESKQTEDLKRFISKRYYKNKKFFK